MLALSRALVYLLLCILLLMIIKCFRYVFGFQVRFVVMGNMFCTELRIHRSYDLKGSTVGRCTDKDKIKENTTLKDLDLSFEFQMDKLLREYLFK